MTSTLRADSIGKSFGRSRILSSARLTASVGQVVGVLGRMGTGKSTLLKICAGVIQPDSGWVEFDGRQYERARLHALATRGMFYLSEMENLSKEMTVRGHFNLIEKRFGPGVRDEAVEFFALRDFLDASVSSLSGGELKRAEMAMALVRRPLCLLADEPFRSADPKVCELLGESFRMLARRGCAVVVTGHEVNALKPYLDSVTWVTSGTTYSLGSVAEAWKHEAFSREYLGAKVAHR